LKHPTVKRARELVEIDRGGSQVIYINIDWNRNLYQNWAIDRSITTHWHGQESQTRSYI